MANKSNYKCNKCGNDFQAIIGRLKKAGELRCIDCDHREYTDLETKEKVCEKCGGKMVNNISLPMCPVCKSRDVNEGMVMMYLD